MIKSVEGFPAPIGRSCPAGVLLTHFSKTINLTLTIAS